MPGFVIGIDANEVGVPAPARPIYSYTWQLDILSKFKIDEVIYLKELSLPEYNIETEEPAGASNRYKIAKSISWNDVKATFYATSDLKDAIKQLKDNVWSPDTGIRPAAAYKFDSSISQFYADDTTLAQVWTLHGSWIRSIAHNTLSYTTSDVHSVTATVAYDWATVE